VLIFGLHLGTGKNDFFQHKKSSQILPNVSILCISKVPHIYCKDNHHSAKFIQRYKETCILWTQCEIRSCW